MTHSKFLPAMAFLICCFSACKKDKPTNPTVYPNYSHLKVGNYWIYERYDIDTNNVATATGIIDSCYIENDTVINGQTYYKKVCPAIPINSLSNSYLRDSLHYTINLNGNILFSSQNFTDTFSVDTVFRYSDIFAITVVKMGDRDLTTITPAGSFKTSSLKTTIYLNPKWTTGKNTRSVDIRYSESVGLVIEGLPIYASSPYHTERRLVRYHVVVA